MRAADSLSRLIGHASDGCSGVTPADDGWRVCVDVVEVPRIPDTTSLLATYEVDLDGDGTLRAYRRVRRYRRGAADQ
ncbi:gas vesicle protein GvpO [Streptomyces sp. NPDC020983]|uniref:gas vesicle protein GvpO n=1 Tax=Streptomyces sp. NPDC020983 TaxID=3365106 RepID=UPI00378DF970